MKNVTRTHLLALAFAASALGLTTTVMESSLPAQATSVYKKVVDDGGAGFTSGEGVGMPVFTKAQHAPAYGGYASYAKKTGNFQAVATWSYADVPPGVYDAFATWAPTNGFSTAVYR